MSISEDRIRVLDLLDYDNDNVQDIAHIDKKKKEADNKSKTDIEKKKEDESSNGNGNGNGNDNDNDNEIKIDIWELVKYVFAGLGVGFVAYQAIKPRNVHHHNVQQHQQQSPVDNNQMMLNLLFLIYQSQMQMLNNNNNNNNNKVYVQDNNSSPSKVLTDRDSDDWIKFYQANKDKILDSDDLMKLDELGVKENWKVERDLKGNILNVWKESEYLR